MTDAECCAGACNIRFKKISKRIAARNIKIIFKKSAVRPPLDGYAAGANISSIFTSDLILPYINHTLYTHTHTHVERAREICLNVPIGIPFRYSIHFTSAVFCSLSSVYISFFSSSSCLFYFIISLLLSYVGSLPSPPTLLPVIYVESGGGMRNSHRF